MSRTPTRVVKKATTMPRNRSRMALKTRIAADQVGDSGVLKVFERPLGNRACCVCIGK